jgi:hypothetical protein
MDLSKWNDPGVLIPMAHDSVVKKPSITLLLMFTANLLAVISLIILHIRSEPIVATSATCLYAVICSVLYIMRQLNKAKFNLKDKSFELDDDEKEPDAKNNL